ncbi:MAG: hypothetical protein J4224_00055 [Candidatus Diapherotrites archaeon]|uniref:Uncharacterized protein n=1 Tax=Candidatus Iainarchaeum sp. TaxID=3101447 RepID=A0A7J4IR30_9ARCH|nr:MAG: hypothetical protein QT03_C0001G1011 [archaeon GW2011_AR10]MBS3058804.1 hypothetical protein [Candidatus Diapherotrites archaeon]HIH07941.1 hypothetical protein [Candidatus Diapherotrites archaeon]
MSRGFIVSLDAVIAVFIFFIVLVSILFFLGRVGSSSFKALALKEFSADALTVLEKSGRLEKAVNENKSAELRQFLNKLPFNVCAEVKLFEQSDLANPFMSVKKPGCNVSPDEIIVLRSSFVVQQGADSNFFLAEINSWHRVET